MVALRHCIHPVEYLYTSVMLSHRQGRSNSAKFMFLRTYHAIYHRGKPQTPAGNTISDRIK